ncbi:uncharacterized protein GrlHz isoform X2 [Panulirus ornatus]|uniref:uncharacterized protein GrlHz isoform X2 n=1 Tax=Panulirus ornatus TaxID=150431 RepID=UPI003A8651C2
MTLQDSNNAVMISECDGESYNTAATLHYCRRRILTPRDIILCLLGYRSWNKDGADQSLCIKVFNVVYFIFLFLCLCIGPVLQYNICLKRDQGIGNEMMIHHVNSSSFADGESHWCSGSLAFVYIIPSLMFFFAFLVTCVIVRLGESEHLQTLLERVYLLASCSPWELVKQRRLWSIFVGWLMMGIFCLVMSLTSMVLHLFAASHISYSFIKPQSKADQIFLCGGALGSLWLEDIVLVLGVLLYCTQCHLLSRLLDIIRTTLYQGATSLMGIKKQIDESARFLHHLNQELGLSVGLYLCLVAFRAITAAFSLFSVIQQYEFSGNVALYAEGGKHKSLEDSFDTGVEHPMMENPTVERVRLWFHISAMITNLLPWLLLTTLPLCMAARVSSNYRTLSKAGCQLHGRPFGYQSTPQLDIDSFLLYVSSLHLQAKILWIPVRTYFLVSILVLAFMSLIVLSYLYL